METRLQKVLADMGLASRRGAEVMIFDGRVTVNGKTAVIGMKVDPDVDHIKVDGKLITKREPKVYLMFHKPAGVVTSMSDPEGRPTVKDYLEKIKFRVYPVGRLDYNSEGLLFVTNDGDFAHSVLHPSKKIPKIYLVKIKGTLTEEEMEKLRTGIKLDDGMTAPAKVKKIRKHDQNSWIEITIHEGKKRQIRRMLDRVGHEVIRLMRVVIAGVPLGDLKPGMLRHLTPEEVQSIKERCS